MRDDAVKHLFEASGSRGSKSRAEASPTCGFPLCQALLTNTHLQELDCSGCAFSDTVPQTTGEAMPTNRMQCRRQ